LSVAGRRTENREWRVESKGQDGKYHPPPPPGFGVKSGADWGSERTGVVMEGKGFALDVLQRSQICQVARGPGVGRGEASWSGWRGRRRQ
jgi:hypothetical protein